MGSRVDTAHESLRTSTEAQIAADHEPDAAEHPLFFDVGNVRHFPPETAEQIGGRDHLELLLELLGEGGAVKVDLKRRDRAISHLEDFSDMALEGGASGWLKFVSGQGASPRSIHQEAFYLYSGDHGVEALGRFKECTASGNPFDGTREAGKRHIP